MPEGAGKSVIHLRVVCVLLMRAIAGEYGSAVGAHLHLLSPRAVSCTVMCDLRFQAVAGGYRTCSCIVRVRQSYSCILCTHVTKPLSYTLPDRSRPRQRRSSGRYSTTAGTQHDGRLHATCTLREARARPRRSWTAASHAPPHSARPSAASPPPAARSTAASRRLALLLPTRLRTAFGTAGASMSAATAAAAAELLGTAAAILNAEERIPVRVERGHSIAARAAAA